MLPLYRDPHFTFHFEERRSIPRIHLDGIEEGTLVTLYWEDEATGKRDTLSEGCRVGVGGWVEFGEPILVEAGDTFVVVPERG